MEITRKTFFKLSGGGAVASVIAGNQGNTVTAQTGAKPKKVEGAAIMGATAAVTKFIVEAGLSAMPADVVEQGKRCLVDGFGVILAGSTMRGSAIIREYARSVSEKKEATAVGADALMTSAAHAALINAGSGHAMDYDDTQLSTTPDRTFGLLTHPTVPVLAAAMAVVVIRTQLSTLLTGAPVSKHPVR